MSPVMNSVTETLASLLGTSCRRERVSWTYQQLECYLVMSSPGPDHGERFRLDLHTVGHHVLGDGVPFPECGIAYILVTVLSWLVLPLVIWLEAERRAFILELLLDSHPTLQTSPLLHLFKRGFETKSVPERGHVAGGEQLQLARFVDVVLLDFVFGDIHI